MPKKYRKREPKTDFSLDSVEKRTFLAQRARQRRLEMELFVSTLLMDLNVCHATFSSWERCLPRGICEGLEAKWEEILEVPAGWLRDDRIETPPLVPPPVDEASHRVVEPIAPAGYETVADEIEGIGRALASMFPGAPTPDQRRERWRLVAFCHRYGIYGENVTTLEAIGKKYGLSREGVRTIVDRVLARGKGRTFATPKIEALEEAIRNRVPARLATLDREWRSLLGPRLSIKCVIRFLADCLKRSELKIITLAEPGGMKGLAEWVVLEGDDPDFVGDVHNAAMALIRANGATQVETVIHQLRPEGYDGAFETQVANACQNIRGFSWLDRESQWFWLGPDSPSSNMLITAAKKILAVANREVPIAELIGGFERLRRRRRRHDLVKKGLPLLSLSEAAAAALLQQVPGVLLVNGCVVRAPGKTIGNVLNDHERVISEVIRRHGGTIKRSLLGQQLVESGRMAPATLETVLVYSPIFRRAVRGYVELRGYETASVRQTAAMVE